MDCCHATSIASAPPIRERPRLFSPSHVVAIDLADSRLEAAKQFGADVTVNNGSQDPLSVSPETFYGFAADYFADPVLLPDLQAQVLHTGQPNAAKHETTSPRELPPSPSAWSATKSSPASAPPARTP